MTSLSQGPSVSGLQRKPGPAHCSGLAGLTPTLSFRNLGLAGSRSQQTDSLHAIPVAVNQELRSP